ncbi:MAG TPA: hypothetical protein VMZ74_13315 [Ramlibacter sp.]|nr:hypothetical protein [Ramlibacter sp.]
MKYAYITAVALAAMAAATTQAQGTRIFRCPGNSYTNSENEAKAKGCKPMDGGSFTVVEGTRVNGAAATKVATAPGQRVDATEQKQRDADARAILEAELKKAESRRDELAREYNNGEPEKLGPEHRNEQKYLDRIAELKASISRNENDIAGIKRELSRAPNSQ